MKLVEICQQHFPHLHILARERADVWKRMSYYRQG